MMSDFVRIEPLADRQCYCLGWIAVAERLIVQQDKNAILQCPNLFTYDLSVDGLSKHT